jgi:hypothetical protein
MAPPRKCVTVKEQRYRQAAAAPVLIFSQGQTPMNMLIGILITFLVIILLLYLVNMLPIDGRAKQIVRVIIIVIGILSILRSLQVLTIF